MGIVHSADVRHDLRLVRAYITFRNAKVWPTRKLQRSLIAAILVAVGFMVTPGLLRDALWVAAALVVVWVLVGDRVVALLRLLRDPYRRTGRAERYEFGDRTFRRAAEPADDAPARPYAHVTAIYADDAYWYLCLRTGEICIVDQTAVDGGSTAPAAFERFLAQKADTEVTRLDLSLSSRAHQAQESRRSYLHSRRGSSIFSRKGPHEDA